MDEDKVGIKALEKLLTDTHGDFSEEVCEDIFLKSKLTEVKNYKEWLNAIYNITLRNKGVDNIKDLKIILDEIRGYTIAALRGHDCFLKEIE